jgi:menaquinone-dependent protoporphyrinogen IX oxidase
LKTIVLYKSRYGSSKKYAKYLAYQNECKHVNIDTFSVHKLKEYDTIIVVGAIYAGSIHGVHFLLEHWREVYDKNIILAAVGMIETEPEAFEKILKRNFFGDVPQNVKVFSLKGAFDYQSLSLTHKGMILSTVAYLKLLGRKRQSTAERFLIESVQTGIGIDLTDSQTLRPIKIYLNELEDELNMM